VNIAKFFDEVNIDTKCCGFNKCKQLYKQHEHALCEPCYWNETRKEMVTTQKKILEQTSNPLKKMTKKLK